MSFNDQEQEILGIKQERKRKFKGDDEKKGNCDESSERIGATVACVVENRVRETVVAVARNWRTVEIYTCVSFKLVIYNQTIDRIHRLVDNPSYIETTDLLSLLAPDEVLVHGSSYQGNSKSLLSRKIDKWKSDFAEGDPEIRPVRQDVN